MLGDSLEECLCKPGAVRWIELWFSDCVYTPWELLGFCVGMSSVFFWLIAQMPQFFTNFLRQSADALSPWFLFQWLAGDSLNLLGCLLTGDQLATETITAFYFIFSDCLIISQYLYYQIRNRDRVYYLDESVHKPANGYHTILQINSSPTADAPPVYKSAEVHNGKQESQQKQESKRPAHSNSNEFGIFTRGERFQDFEEEKLHKHQVALASGRKSVPPCHSRRQLRRVVAEYGLDYGPPSVWKLTTQHASHLSRIDLRTRMTLTSPLESSRKGNNGLSMAGMMMMGVPVANASRSEPRASRKLMIICSSSKDQLAWMKHTGVLFGWISSALYLGSRISQLVQNNKRKSAEGLSLAMVSCAVLANLTYGTAILMRANTWEDLIGKAPWLVGSLGTVSLDITIFLQARYLSSKYPALEPNERTPLLP